MKMTAAIWKHSTFVQRLKATPNIDPKIQKGSHGGKLEQGFERFPAREGTENPEFDLRNR